MNAKTRTPTHPFTVHDLWDMERVADPRPSPDGSLIALTVSRLDKEANRMVPNVWLVGADGTGLRQLTTHAKGSSSARWAPDGGSLFFLSARGDSSQVWRLPIDGGEARRTTDLPLDVGGFALSPDGETLVVALEVFPGTTPAQTIERLDEERKKKATGRIYEQLPVRHWDTWKDGRRSQLFAVPVSGGEAIALMGDMDADAPTKPFGGMDEVAFTPDGAGLLFCAHDRGREMMWTTDVNIYYVPLNGSANPKCLTTESEAWDTDPVFSPDGKHLAWLAMERPGFESDRLRIMLRAWPDGEPRALTRGWDRSAGTIVFSPSGDTIWTAAQDLGHRSLFAVDVKSGTAELLLRGGNVGSVAALGESVVFTLDHFRAPAELHRLDPGSTEPVAITRINADRLALCRVGEPEQFTFRGWNDEKVYAWVVKPIDFDPTRKYPVAYLIHGGPQGSFGANFHYRWNPQVYAARGYAAVMVDFHGSTGYGQDFTDSISGHWGDRPYEDLVKGLAATLERFPWMDGGRVAALGASFGGYMINWLAGQVPDLFRCFVNHDGNLDERMAYYATEELWFPEWERGGPPWEAPESYAEHNPIDFVDKWQTPMLVIHGANDFRVVETQGLATFTALQRRGIPSKLLYFPDENHWVTHPANSVLWHDTVLDWLDEWTG